VQVDTYKAEYMSKCTAAASQGASVSAVAGLATAGSKTASAYAVAGLATAGSDASVYALVNQPSAGVNTTGGDGSVQVCMLTVSLSHALCNSSQSL